MFNADVSFINTKQQTDFLLTLTFCHQCVIWGIEDGVAKNQNICYSVVYWNQPTLPELQ